MTAKDAIPRCDHRHGRGHPHPHTHGHLWLVGLIGVAAGLLFLVYVPSLPAISGTLLLFGGFHLVGALILLSSLYVMVGSGIARRLRVKRADGFDFGWASAWSWGPSIAALILIAAAVALSAAAPGWWPLALFVTVLAVSFFVGGKIARTTGSYPHAVLPMVDLLTDDTGLVLDAGSGAGRTTVALGRALRRARFVALDRFDSGYIEGGGAALLERNLRRAGMSERVRIERGDLTAMPFTEATFDAIVSAHATDHLGAQTAQGLREIYRVLKPGGRFLLIVWVPGWTMFAIVSVLALFLASKARWRKLTADAGFRLADEGMFNGYWFALLQKPEA